MELESRILTSKEPQVADPCSKLLFKSDRVEAKEIKTRLN